MAKYVVLLLTFIVFISCTPSPRFTSTPENTPPPRTAKRTPPTSTDRAAPPELSTNLRIGQMFVGIASYYGTKYHGRLTANGEVYDMYGISAAHKTLPFNTKVRVKNLKNNREILVRINDRGPFIKGRILDLSYGAARKLDMVTDGTSRVSIEIVELGDNVYVR